MALLTNLLQQWKSSNTVLGLEITDTCLKIAELQLSKRSKPLLTRAVKEPLPPDTVEEGRIKNPLALHSLLQNVVKWNDFRTNRVHFVIPSSVIMVRHLKLPNVDDRSMRRILDFELKHHIHLPFERPYYDHVNLDAGLQTVSQAPRLGFLTGKPKRAVVDTELARKEAAPASAGGSDKFTTAEDLFRDLEPDSESKEQARQADVLLVAAPGDSVDEYASLLKECGLKPLSAEIKPLSLYRIVEAFDGKLAKGTLLMVDVNMTSADISIFYEGHLKITRNVLVNFQTNGQKDKQREDPLFGSFADPDGEFQQSCSELAHEMERLMNFYRYTLNNRDQEFHTTVLTGDPERLQDLSAYLEERLNQAVIQPRMDWLDTRVASAGTLLPQIAVPLGLGIRGRTR